MRSTRNAYLVVARFEGFWSSHDQVGSTWVGSNASSPVCDRVWSYTTTPVVASVDLFSSVAGADAFSSAVGADVSHRLQTRADTFLIGCRCGLFPIVCIRHMFSTVAGAVCSPSVASMFPSVAKQIVLTGFLRVVGIVDLPIVGIVRIVRRLIP